MFENLYKNLLSSKILSVEYFGNYVLDYILSISFFILLYFLFTGIIKIITKFISKLLLKKTNSEISGKFSEYTKTVLCEKIKYLIVVIVFFIALDFLELSKKFEAKLNILEILLIAFFSTRLFIDIIKFYIVNTSPKVGDTGKPSGALYLLLPIIKIFIWLAVFFFVLSNLGYNINTLLTGVGVGGVALALAAQSFLGDILSYISIVSDKPFELGDYVSVAGSEGNVVKIGIKSVRILSYTGEEIVVPNATITSSKLQNFRKMNKRRVDLEFQLTLDLPNEKLEQIPLILKKIIEEKKVDLEFGRSHLAGFSTFGYIFKTVYYIIGNDYLKYMNFQQYVNLRLRQELYKIEAKLASPIKDIRLIKQDKDFL